MASRFDPQNHHRRSVRLPGYDYTRPGAYFVTIVTHQRQSLFGEVVGGEMVMNRLGKMARREWERLPIRFEHVELGIFVIMPNHLHGIIVLRDDRRGTADCARSDGLQALRRAPTQEHFGKPVAGSLPTIIRSFKSAVAFRAPFLQPELIGPLWQKNYYEHIIRDDDDYDRVHLYIQTNPLKWDDDAENQP